MNEKNLLWLTISSKIFVDFLDDTKLLLYDTSNGNFMYSNDKKLYDIISRLYLPSNLGAILYEDAFTHTIEEAVHKSFLSIYESPNTIKPIRLLPILSLQKDLERNLPEQNIGDKYELLGNKLYYLSGIYVSLDCGVVENEEMARHRNFASLQYPCVRYEKAYAYLSEIMLVSLLRQIRSSSVGVVDFICTHRYFHKCDVQTFVELLENYSFKYRIHIYAEDYMKLSEQDRIALSKVGHFFVYMDSFTPQDMLEFECSLPKQCRVFHLLYRSSKLEANSWQEYLPVWTNENEEMFRENVWISLKNLQWEPRKMSYLFRNQKLNSNFFGILDISCSGNIYPHGSSHRIGTISKKYSIVEALSLEFRENHSWRVTRKDFSHCKHCPFRNICPPIAISELMRPDIKMCNINTNRNENE